MLDDPAAIGTGAGAEAQLARAMQGAAIPIMETPPERTWIWSDLHLADRSILLVWNRPFWSIEEMNRHLLTRWSEPVGAGDTIICLGDVGHPDAWRDRRLVVSTYATVPASGCSILGNHDVDHTEALQQAGFAELCTAALCATEPPLALTHISNCRHGRHDRGWLNPRRERNDPEGGHR